ncbi:hypothetical protein TNCV_329481 [Trichonephila clavipes]|nr:hypothetical protein TNCV_329481 [Trichonephila clavipes]
MFVTVVWGTKYSSNRKSFGEVGGRGTKVEFLTSPRVFFFKNGVDSNQNVLSLAWCSKLLLTTDVILPPYHDESCGPRFGTADQVALATTITNGNNYGIVGQNGTVSGFIYCMDRIRCPVPIDSDKRRSTVIHMAFPPVNSYRVKTSVFHIS